MPRIGFGSVPISRRVRCSRPAPTGRARELREQMTSAEQQLWERLRGRRFLGLKFRRQFPVQGYVADFCCYEKKLIVELDGGIHEDSAQIAHDENRDLFLQSLGFKIVRFPNEQVLEDPDSVLQAIAFAAKRTHLLEDTI